MSAIVGAGELHNQLRNQKLKRRNLKHLKMTHRHQKNGFKIRHVRLHFMS